MTSLIRRILTAAGPLLALLVVIAFFAIADAAQGFEGRFLTSGSARLVGLQSVKIGIAALGMTMIIIAGGIDLSAGTAAALCGCTAAWTLQQGGGIAAAFAVAIATGMLCGCVNGSLVSLLRLVPFIITLGTMTVFMGLGKTIADEGGTITPPVESIPDWLVSMVTQFPEPEWIAYPILPNFCWGVWLWLVLAAGVSFLLHRTVLGRHLYAIGSNESTARLCGVPVVRTKLLVYSLAGCLVGLAGMVDLARMGKGDASAGMGLELEIIAAVVIGGGSLSGGRGSVIGTICGVLIMGVINHGCTALGLENQVENILLGAIIITAVYVDRLRNQN
ncbi:MULTISPECIES: ABC transporter permease [Crateriforma]|uniref:Ribose transport system permease protein RbsC n=1 Tax=Crateriforma conspicua TaxID=2527996 RepID=A0A5C6G237_9PLAN|nr:MULTISPECIES: ABC transporter permease [Crateriforma]TWU67738.1 Ribose transport system permease protein RbsC [Crateriforma conspicua]